MLTVLFEVRFIEQVWSLMHLQFWSFFFSKILLILCVTVTLPMILVDLQFFW